MPYFSVDALNLAIDHIVNRYPIAEAISLPEPSAEGRAIKALKIANGAGARAGVLFLGGAHARELINPETVVRFAFQLCDAYTSKAGLTFGPKNYTPSAIQMVVNGLDIFLLPMVNPDGRNFCLTGGDPMWRKNRSSHAGLPCRGVDLNRNYDFLWSSGIGTSSNSCTEIFKGPGAFSEPETRNVRWMIDNFPNLSCLVDIHSYSELVLYPWGDDDNQTTDPNQNFQNPAFDGERGGPSGYREYIPAGDLHEYVVMAERMRDGIAAVRGRVYTAEQAISLYPTTGTAQDYAYSRYFVDTGRRRILGLTLETAREFQPLDAEKDNVITEVSAGLIECLLETLCPAEFLQSLIDTIFPLHAMRRFRDQHMLITEAGARYERMFRAHSLELVKLAEKSKAAREAGSAILRVASQFFTDEGDLSPRKITSEDIVRVANALAVVRKAAGGKLKADIDIALTDVKKLKGKSLQAAFKLLGKQRADVKPKSYAVSARSKRGKRRAAPHKRRT
jgi:murein tripeptide amidase MpaA